MPEIKLPDGKKIPFKKNIDGFEIAGKISKSLLKEACVMSVDGELKDLGFVINKDVQVKIITSKDKEGLEVIRHDAAHVLAMAVQELFPKTQVTIGPVIEEDLLVFKNILKKSDSIINQWGGKLYFVYLPPYEIYRGYEPIWAAREAKSFGAASS